MLSVHEIVFKHLRAPNAGLSPLEEINALIAELEDYVEDEREKAWVRDSVKDGHE